MTMLASRPWCAKRRSGIGLVVVLGNPAYYQSFGFGAAALLGLRCTWVAKRARFRH